MSGRYSTYSKLKIDYPHQRVLRITFDRPETYNSVDAETHTELTHIWRDINEDPDIGAVIVTGAGKAFSAGGDFEMIKQIIASPATRMTTLEGGQGPRLQRDQLQQANHFCDQWGRCRGGLGRGYPCRYLDLREISADR